MRRTRLGKQVLEGMAYTKVKSRLFSKDPKELSSNPCCKHVDPLQSYWNKDMFMKRNPSVRSLSFIMTIAQGCSGWNSISQRVPFHGSTMDQSQHDNQSRSRRIWSGRSSQEGKKWIPPVTHRWKSTAA